VADGPLSAGIRRDGRAEAGVPRGWPMRVGVWTPFGRPVGWADVQVQGDAAPETECLVVSGRRLGLATRDGLMTSCCVWSRRVFLCALRGWH
jgi:hypothetical protein